MYRTHDDTQGQRDACAGLFESPALEPPPDSGPFVVNLRRPTGESYAFAFTRPDGELVVHSDDDHYEILGWLALPTDFEETR